MIKNISIRYCGSNEKYDMIINDKYVGKFYSIFEVLGAIMRELATIEHKRKKNDTLV